MNIPLRRVWTQDEFFAWAGAQEGRFEFDGFQPVAMTGGTAGHSVIAQNILFTLRNRLRDSGCRPLGPDAGVATVGTAVRYPDALVTCSRFGRGDMLIPGVVAVFEVTQSDHQPDDRTLKLREYAAVASIRRYVILESTSIGLTVMDRDRSDEAWRVTALTSGDVLRMPEIGIEVPVAEFYEELEFTDEADGG